MAGLRTNAWAPTWDPLGEVLMSEYEAVRCFLWQLAKSFGELDAYLGDDGLVYPY